MGNEVNCLKYDAVERMILRVAMQTWRFTVIQNTEKISELKAIVTECAKKKKVLVHGWNNPVALILVSNDKRNATGIQDCACAAENMMLAAASYGIGTVWLNALMTLSDEPEVRELLNSYGIPERHTVWAMVALGYPDKKTPPIARKVNVVQWV